MTPRLSEAELNRYVEDIDAAVKRSVPPMRPTTIERLNRVRPDHGCATEEQAATPVDGWWFVLGLIGGLVLVFAIWAGAL